MGSMGPILRISSGLALLTISILLGLDQLGWVPSGEKQQAEVRVHMAEAVAAQVTSAVERGDLRAVKAALSVAVRQNEGLESGGLRSGAGRLLVDVGEHLEGWDLDEDEKSTAGQMRIPLFRSGEKWGTVELRFANLASSDPLTRLWEHPLLRLAGLMGGVGFLFYGFYMRRTLRHLDPSAVIPSRVQTTLDVMTEGVVILSTSDEIVMANEAFARRFGKRPSDLMGRKASGLGWRDRSGTEVATGLPWSRAMRDSTSFVGETLTLNRSEQERVILTINGAPVLDGWGRPTGAIVTFDDVTELEQNRSELQQTLSELEKSRDEIRLQNEELQLLARSDPLTGAANRRSFMEDVEPLLAQKRAAGEELCCLMADIDHFKKVNDEHGHQTGDVVIRRVAEALLTELGGRGIVCRYGGEEFCVALPDAAIEEAEALAERVRRQICAPGFTSVPISASVGVASIHDGAVDLTGLLDQADQALYHSKENGRNRVSRFDRI